MSYCHTQLCYTRRRGKEGGRRGKEGGRRGKEGGREER